jgi:hypothetical protein
MSTAPTRSTAHELSVAAILTASVAVLAASLLASFRQGFADDLPTALTANGARVLSAAAVGALLSLAGSLRLERGSERALRDLELLAVSAGGAGGGFLAAQLAGSGPAALAAGAAGALLGGGALFAAVRSLDRPRRFANGLAALALAGMIVVAALAGSYARARTDAVAPLVAWLLGDLGALGGASLASGGALAIAAAVLVARAIATPRDASGASRLPVLGLLAFGIGLGAAGPLVLVGSLVPRTVRHLTRTASEPARTAACALAGAAAVAAVDAVPRLLVGGYDFPFNVPAGMLLIPILLGWNRARLRRTVGPVHWLFEVLEIGLIVAMTLAAAGLALLLARVIAFAT